MTERQTSGAGGYPKFILYLVVVVLLNVSGMTMFFRADLTANKVYSLSKASIDAVSTLSEPLTIKVFFSSNLPAPYNNIERYLHDLLQEYSTEGGRLFNYQFHDLSGKDPEITEKNEALARNYGVNPVQLQNIEQDEMKFVKAYMGIVMLHGDIVEAIPMISSTDGLEYEITSSLIKMNNKISALLRIRDKVKVKLYLSSSLNIVGPYLNIPEINGRASMIDNIVQKLNSKHYNKLAFTHIDPSLSRENSEEASSQKLLQMKWDTFQDRSGRSIPAGTGYAGLIIQHEDKIHELELISITNLPIFGTQYELTPAEELETGIAGALEKVININEEIGFLSSHGTLGTGAAQHIPGMPSTDSITNFKTLLSESYSIKDIDLKQGIPEGISFLMIAGPKEPFSDYELYQIDQFLMKGNNLALFIDPFQEVSPEGQNDMFQQFQQPTYLPLNTGLEKLLNHYGISADHSLVLDENSYRQTLSRQAGGGDRAIYFAPLIKNENIANNAAYLQNIKGLVTLKTSPLTLNESVIEKNEITATPLFSSSKRSWLMSGKIKLNPMFINPPANEAEFSKKNLAYVLEGSFPSYFTAKEIPQRNMEQSTNNETQAGMDTSSITSQGVTVKKGRNARIFLTGTSEILKDNFIDKLGGTPNAHFIMNLVDYMNNREATAVMRSKTQAFNPLEDIKPSSRTLIKTLNIAGLPLLIVLSGIIVWIKRRSRKKLIQKIFSN
ncbi:MAG: Gldg family protein [Nitrospira sp.]|nr:Gldg family protein [bacterium]MBL7050150.1 Gldg family protein [Nitrospira sp.]